MLLPMAFAQAGYQTLGTGKLLHGGSGGKNTFDEYFSVEQRWSPFPGSAVRYTDEELPTKGTDSPRHVVKDSRGRSIILPLNGMPSDRRPDSKDGESFDWGPIDVPDSEMGDAQITDWAIEKMENGFDSPFFLGVGYYRPHIPLWAPKKYFDRFSQSPAELPPVKPDDLDDLSAVARNWAIEPVTAGRHSTVVEHQQWRAAVEAYLACTTFVDDQIGRLLDALDNTSFGDNTVIVLWSDHGWHLGEKQHWGKWTGWERSTRVPLIIVPANKFADRFAPAGSRCDQPVSLIDLYPTLTELCDVAPPDKLDGQSLVPLLSEPSRATGRSVITTFDPGNTSLRTRHWRHLRYADGSEELYDHRKDPHEWDNLANSTDHAETKKRLTDKLNNP
jgi:arylsulfatase A-like enzyme